MQLDDQLKNLQNFEAQPPADIFASIVGKIKEEEKTTSGIVDSKVAELKQFSKVPPTHLYGKVIKLIFKENKQGKVVSFNAFVKIAAAACAIFIVGLWALKSNSPGKVAEQPITASVMQPAVIESLTGADTVDATPEHTKQHVAKSSLPVKVKKVGEKYDIIIDNEVFTVSDNDLFASFTSFDPDNLPEFITSTDSKSVVIRVDKSTSINLSQGMASLLQDLYKVKSNGKPTGKARRTKRKFDKWKEADSKYFDDKVQKNPMDPVDLGEFLF